MKYHVKNDSYYEFKLQIAQVFLEELNDMLVADFMVRNIDALGCASCNINYLMEGWVLKCL